MFQDKLSQLLQPVFAHDLACWWRQTQHETLGSAADEKNCILCLAWITDFSGTEQFPGVLGFPEFKPGKSWAHWDESITLLTLTETKWISLSFFFFSFILLPCNKILIKILNRFSYYWNWHFLNFKKKFLFKKQSSEIKTKGQVGQWKAEDIIKANVPSRGKGRDSESEKTTQKLKRNTWMEVSEEEKMELVPVETEAQGG